MTDQFGEHVAVRGQTGAASMLTEQAGALRLGSKASSLIDGCLPTGSFGFLQKTSEGKYPCCSSPRGQVTPRDEEERVPKWSATNRDRN